MISHIEAPFSGETILISSLVISKLDYCPNSRNLIIHPQLNGLISCADWVSVTADVLLPTIQLVKILSSEYGCLNKKLL